jgi:hypothetical protein
MPEHGPHGFEIVVLFPDLHSDAMAEVMWLQHRVVDDPAVGFFLMSDTDLTMGMTLPLGRKNVYASPRLFSDWV